LSLDWARHVRGLAVTSCFLEIDTLSRLFGLVSSPCYQLLLSLPHGPTRFLARGSPPGLSDHLLIDGVVSRCPRSEHFLRSGYPSGLVTTRVSYRAATAASCHGRVLPTLTETLSHASVCDASLHTSLFHLGLSRREQYRVRSVADKSSHTVVSPPGRSTRVKVLVHSRVHPLTQRSHL
jgi:hypothetical protein